MGHNVVIGFRIFKGDATVSRILRTAIVSAAVLLSGTVAFAVAAATAPPGAEHVRVVVTDRPVAALTAPSETAPVQLVPTTARPTSDAPDAKPHTAVASPSNRPTAPRVISGKRPPVTTAPIAKPTPPVTSADSDSDHEVVTPPVRDDDDDRDDSDNVDKSDSPSADSKGE